MGVNITVSWQTLIPLRQQVIICFYKHFHSVESTRISDCLNFTLLAQK